MSILTWTKIPSSRFNSLQTGKPIQRGYHKRRYLGIYETFQFPSNGKAYPKSNRCCHRRPPKLQVSIPFKRESLSKVLCISQMNTSLKWSCFNSLQTGKPIQRNPDSPVSWLWRYFVSIPFKRESLSKEVIRIPRGKKETPVFQFPSNGKAYPKRYRYRRNRSGFECVSIPFKRESLSKE